MLRTKDRRTDGQTNTYFCYISPAGDNKTTQKNTYGWLNLESAYTKENTGTIIDVTTGAVIVDGYKKKITTLSESFYESLDPKPEMIKLSEL